MWQSFNLGNLYIEAKVYRRPSMWGIKNGRVSKLLVYSFNKELLYEYDRGGESGEIEDYVIDKVLEMFK